MEEVGVSMTCDHPLQDCPHLTRTNAAYLKANFAIGWPTPCER